MYNVCFFFKQKTAYEMRISDWSSDVCSSDLGKVVKLMDFGAFVTISPDKDGLVHVSQISNERVEKVSDKLKEGDIVKVKVLEVDKIGRASGRERVCQYV